MDDSGRREAGNWAEWEESPGIFAPPPAAKKEEQEHRQVTKPLTTGLYCADRSLPQITGAPAMRYRYLPAPAFPSQRSSSTIKFPRR